MPTAIERLRTWVELSRGGAANVPAMEGVRGFAVFLVFVAHYLTLTEPWLPASGAVREISNRLFSLGLAGVDLFFVLSGYLIYGSWIRRRPRLVSYLRRRAQRIYPAFLAVLAVYVVLDFVRPDVHRLPGAPGPAILYLVANLIMLPGLFPITPLMTVAWSLSYEVAFYLALPLVVMGLRLREWSSRARASLFVGAGVAGLVACALFGGPVRLTMFLVGMLLVEVEGRAASGTRPVHARPAARITGAIGVVLVAAGLAIASGPTPDAGSEAIRAGALGICTFVVFRSAFAGSASVAARLFSWTPLRWLGNVSYSYYLVHGLALNAIVLGVRNLDRLGLEPGPRPWLVLAGVAPAFAATLGLAVVLFLLVERPFSLEPVGTPAAQPGTKGPGPKTRAATLGA